jgi:hypothetical protein
MPSVCDRHNRVRIIPENWEALVKLRYKMSPTVSIPSLTNAVIKAGIKNFKPKVKS